MKLTIRSKKVPVTATTGRSTSTEYIKVALFDYLIEEQDILIDDEPAERIIERIQKLDPIFDVDDVLEKSAEEMVGISEAISMLEDELAQM